MSNFQKATRLKLRFNYKGSLTVEDLWDLKLETLDAIARGLNKEIKDQDEESFIKPIERKDSRLTLSLEIVKEIISVKLAELKAKEQAKEITARRNVLLEEISRKQLEQLGARSLEDLQAELNSLA